LPSGEIDYNDLRKHLLANKDKPAILNVNIGTTVKGAVDDIDKVGPLSVWVWVGASRYNCGAMTRTLIYTQVLCGWVCKRVHLCSCVCVCV
jgi:hypothetical protein